MSKNEGINADCVNWFDIADDALKSGRPFKEQEWFDGIDNLIINLLIDLN